MSLQPSMPWKFKAWKANCNEPYSTYKLNCCLISSCNGAVHMSLWIMLAPAGRGSSQNFLGEADSHFLIMFMIDEQHTQDRKETVTAQWSQDTHNLPEAFSSLQFRRFGFAWCIKRSFTKFVWNIKDNWNRKHHLGYWRFISK